MTLVEFINKNHPSVGIAKLIFNFLGEKYPKVALSKVIDSSSGGTPNRGISNYYGGDIPWLKSGEITDGLVTEFSETITEEGMKNSSAKLFPKGTLLVAMYGATAGKTGILDFDSTTNQALCAIFPKKGILRDYLFWYFRQARVDFIELSKGGAQPNISQTVIGRALIPFPDENIQKSVIDFLSEIEGKDNVNPDFIFPEIYSQINQLFSHRQSYSGFQTELKTQSNLLSKLRQSYLQEAVMGKLTEPSQDNAQTLLKAIKSQKAELIKQGKLRKEKPLAPIKPEEIPFEIPDNWVWCRLGDLATLITDGTHQTPSYVEKGRIFLSAQNIKPFRFIPEVHRFVSEKDYQEYVKIKKCKKGDILIARVGAGIGESAVIDQELDFAFYVSLGLVKVIQNFIFPDFIVTYINSPNGVSYSKGNIASKGTSAGNFNLERIRNFPIPLPPLSEQKAIVEKVEGLLGNISLLESENKAQHIGVQRLMGAVLQEAFGGK